jgi:predicted AAA+ superfamily ATPase
VVLVGPRQVGKTTLALEIGRGRDAIYLDLESPGDRARLTEPELYLAEHLDQLVILDEVHRVPELFPTLRSLIDRARRAGRSHGLYLILGSASVDMLRQSGETLAGRVSYLHLDPLDITEVGGASDAADRLWVRGGFPNSYLAENDAASIRWRVDFIRTYLERDIAQLGPRIPAEALRRCWTMLAHSQGDILNVARVAAGLGMDARTVGRYVDLLCDLLLVRRLPPWHANTGKRLVRSPKVYIRDTGLVHALLGIPDLEALLSHPVAGPSWEGHVIEQVLSVAPERAEAFFYRTSGGAEIDLLLVLPGGALRAIEIKRSLDPRPTRGFHEACDDLRPSERMVAYPGDEAFAVAPNVRAMPVMEVVRSVMGARPD